ncbi:MAG: phenylalanine--tRNA ligase subunit beta [Candidatus Omnitrophica bacterium]|nr:phenylalanine--tRNA ligase subunit beta [Candidatus Omnitrophota bacterium]
MKVTYNWLKDFVEIRTTPQSLAEKLTMAGLEVVSLEEVDKDWVLEIEVTTNRPDWLSIIGIAREVSAITGGKFKVSSIKNTTCHLPLTRLPFEIKIEDKKGCPRYIGRVIENVEIKPSPSWLQKRLTAVGLRPINNVVDITNYCLFETGQPMHAFDYEKIENQTIIVRKAKDKESIVTIDGEERKLDSSMLIIADKIKPIAIAGIMGGKNTEVSEFTKTVLLESAYFDPLTIRGASQKLGLVTESSYRFERKVDLDTVLNASLRALELFEKYASFKKKILVSKIKDVGSKKDKEKTISLNTEEVNKFLGEKISSSHIEKILKRLGFSVKRKKDLFEIKPPFFRRDIVIEEDLMEEIARIYGYDKFPLTLPQEEISQAIPPAPLYKTKMIFYEILTGLGFSEVITYSLVGKNLLAKVNLSDEKEWVKVLNPLSKEQEFLRPTLLASILEVIAHNLKYQTENLKIFEWGKIYFHKELPQEIPYLGICLSGKTSLGWLKKEEELSFYDLKGVVELVLGHLGIKKVNFLKKESSYLEKGYSAEIAFGEESLGFLGKVKEDIQRQFDLPTEVYWAELDLNKVVFFSSFEKRYVSLPKFPFVLRDISFLVKEDIAYEKIEGFLKNFPCALIKEITLIDVYKGANIPLGKKSLTFSLKFQSEQRTLRDEEVEESLVKLRKGLEEEFQAELR